LNHAVMKGCLFMVAGAIIYKTGFKNIDDFKGIAKKMPYTSAAFFIAAASMIGIPPTVGFMSKWYLALGALDAGQWAFVAVILASSLLSAIYFWRIFEYAYFRDSDAHDPHMPVSVDEAPAGMLAPMLVLALACILFGLFVIVPLSIIEPVVITLLGGG
jgi:multicomponent Na+:H+ antiporter subunit D